MFSKSFVANEKNFRVKQILVNVYFKGSSSDDLDLNMCCQDHDSKWPSTGLIGGRYSLKKLTKEF